MKSHSCLLVVLLFFLVSCRGLEETAKEKTPNNSVVTSTPCAQIAYLDRETAILIAKGDAVENYTVSVYDIIAEEREDAWRIVFRLKDPGVTGGGPDYLIDKKTGKILNATYYK